MKQEYLDSKSHEIGRCFRLFQPDMSVVLSNGSRRRSNLVTTNPYQQDFSGIFGLPKSHGCRKLSVPLIEPLSIRLQEGNTEDDDDDDDDDDEEVTVSMEPNFNTIKSSKSPILCGQGVVKSQRIRRNVRSGEYINNAMIAMQRGELFSRESTKALTPFNSTHCNLDRREEKETKPPPLPPKPKNRRPWTNWRVFPNRKIDKKPIKPEISVNTATMMDDSQNDQIMECREILNSDDEILYVTSAFNRKCNRGVESDENVEYATCSVSDLVAVFEAKAAQIAAMETASLCSEPITPPPHLECEELDKPTPTLTRSTAMEMEEEADVKVPSTPPLPIKFPQNQIPKFVGRIYELFYVLPYCFDC